MTADNLGIRAGLCQCGCGSETRIADRTYSQRGWVKGRPMRFIDGHNKRGSGSPWWRGGTATYKAVSRSRGRGETWEHRAIAERALGKPLPKGAEVHHVDGDKRNNGRGNLVVCQDAAYHRLLHVRTKALKACGNPNYRRCSFCGQWDDPANLYRAPRGNHSHHRECLNRERRGHSKSGH